MNTLKKFLIIAEDVKTGQLVPFTIVATDEDSARDTFRAHRNAHVDLFHMMIQTVFPVVL